MPVFKGSIIYGCKVGYEQLSDNTLVQSLRNHLCKLQYKKGCRIQLPIDLRDEETYWIVNGGLGDIKVGKGISLNYDHRNENPQSFHTVYENTNSTAMV